jgi:putative copper resistance protein D
MWAGGDGLMMALAMGLMVSVITSPARRTRLTGAWLDSARRATLAAHSERSGGTGDAAATDDLDPDGDAALDAYNRALQRLSSRQTPGDSDS